jgi:UDP-glucose:(heptosyl)LPS alpha-1,3-glucosyltransferase
MMARVGFGQAERVRASATRRQHRLRVALVAHEVHSLGGMERACAELVRLAHHEVEFVLIAAAVAPEIRPLVEWRKVPTVRRPASLRFLLFFLVGSLRLMRERVDVVHTVGAIVGNRSSLVTVQFCHAAFLRQSGKLSPPGGSLARRANRSVARLLAIAAERWAYRQGHCGVLAAVSKGVAEELSSHYPTVPVRITPNGVDLVRFSREPRVRELLRSQAGVATEDRILLFVGGDWYRKGLDVAIAALAIAKRATGRKLWLWVVGGGDQHGFVDIAKRQGLGDEVVFFGRCKDLERFYQAADIFVFPTMYEAFPLVALEAAAASLPIVASNTNGIDELLEKGSGLIVPRTPQAFAEAIVRVAEDARLGLLLGRAARESAERFSWERSVRDVLSIYRDLKKPDDQK